MVRGASPPLAFAALLLGASAILAPSTCNGPESATMAAPGARAAADSLLAERLVASVRGANPVVCDLAARALDQGWWGHSPRVEVGMSEDLAAREVAAWALSRREDASAVPVLARGLSDADPCVRRLSARLLGRTRSQEAVAALRAGLVSADPGEREMAALGLGYAEDGDALPVLVDALDDVDARVRVAAAWALGQLEDPAAIQPLAETLTSDKAAPVREAAAWALGEIE